MTTFEALALVAVGAGLLLLGLIFAEVRKVPRIRKPLRALSTKAEKALAVPCDEGPVITEQHMVHVGVLVSNALLKHEYNQAMKASR